MFVKQLVYQCANVRNNCTRITRIALQTRISTVFFGLIFEIRVVSVRSADAVIHVPIRTVISTRITRIALQTRILWILFIYPCNIRVIRVPIILIISTRITRIASQTRIKTELTKKRYSPNPYGF